MFEYVMLAGINDTAEDAHRLLLLTQGIECKYNLIEFNAHPGTRFQGTDPETMQAFRCVNTASDALHACVHPGSNKHAFCNIHLSK